MNGAVFRMLSLLILCLGGFGTASGTARCQEPGSLSDSVYQRVIMDGSDSLSCYLGYPLGVASVRPDFGDNAKELFRLKNFISRSLEDTLIRVASIRLTGYCSVDGSYDVNERLARRRAEGFRDYLEKEYGLSSRYPVETDWVAEDWDRLRELIAGSDMVEKEDILYLIDHTGVFDGLEKKLMDFRGGDPYKYMYKEFFPSLRRVEIKVVYDLRKIIEERLQRTLTEEEFQAELERERAQIEAERRRREEEALRAAEAERLAEEARVEAEKRRVEAEKAEAERREAERIAAEKARIEAERAAAARREAELKEQRREQRRMRPLLAVKTNLVAWAGLTPDFDFRTFTPNLEAEYYFADRWSVAASAAYAYWKYDGGSDFWGLSSYSVEPRFWLADDGLFRGLCFGVYGQAGDFDVQEGRLSDGVSYANHTGTYWSAGVSVGYTLPLSRHWAAELSLRAGYRAADADVYDREPAGNYFNRSITDNKFTLTGIRLNIVYRFGR